VLALFDSIENDNECLQRAVTGNLGALVSPVGTVQRGSLGFPEPTIRRRNGFLLSRLSVNCCPLIIGLAEWSSPHFRSSFLRAVVSPSSMLLP